MIICGLVEGHQILEKEVNKENHRNLIFGWLRSDYFHDLKLNFNRAANICFSSVGVGRVNFCSIKSSAGRVDLDMMSALVQLTKSNCEFSMVPQEYQAFANTCLGSLMIWDQQ